ncbi:NAD kinase [Spirochaetia bacterium]|nr:NAD kinase [Spirochaetia bacterium]GHU34981.1 NAD kinase [Spirochaetia bacterium]
MKKTIQQALLFMNPHKAGADSLADHITGILEKEFSIQLSLFDETKALPDADIAFSLGGDGTVLSAARILAPRAIPLLAINLGTVGFLAATAPDHWRTVFEQWLAGTLRLSRRILLEMDVERSGSLLFHGTCLNDAVIATTGLGKLIRLEVYTDSIRIGSYRSDGLILATPTGSTAYSLSAGGPILDPELDAIIVNPICPFSLSARPFVLSTEKPVIVAVESPQRSTLRLTLDGQIRQDLEPGDRIIVKKAPSPALLIALDLEIFYRALDAKFIRPEISHA